MQMEAFIKVWVEVLVMKSAISFKESLSKASHFLRVSSLPKGCCRRLMLLGVLAKSSWKRDAWILS